MAERRVHLPNARTEEQRSVMEGIVERDECPFCPDNLHKTHKAPILKQGDHWTVTDNQWPYAFTRVHLLFIARYHAEELADLQPGAGEELLEHAQWAERRFDIAAGGLAMRYGDITLNGATVNHLHAHDIAPSLDKPDGEKIRFKLSS